MSQGFVIIVHLHELGDDTLREEIQPKYSLWSIEKITLT